MTESPDDKVLDDYLTRDSGVSRAYRHMDSPDIPPAIDAAVMARARAAVTEQATRRRAWTRWSAPVALAATVVLGIAVVLRSGVEETVQYGAPQMQEAPAETARDAAATAAVEQVMEQPIAPASPEPVAAPPPPASESREAESARAAKERRNTEESVAVERKSQDLSDFAMPAPKREPTLARQSAEAERDAGLMTRPAEADKVLEEGMEPQKQESPAYAATRTEPSRVKGSPAVVDGPMNELAVTAQTPRLSPAAWLERIRTLRRDGKVLEADEQWERFKEAYPDVIVSETDFARPTPQ